ncbi:COG0659 Sulfate permease and related transporters (MFS superfamily) [Vibrio sp. B1FIG11]|uniref:SulP family inorganic anion transporter n=1 Tax=Vibrio sp. B1FIG11 TaxID=2751177 RepID=UPI001AF1AB79|nr:SulP family inorganic anion transporter [Vibrio sp. B1FIG11]CAD7819013.1 COG0659 Sulfate permease and related transporters (MFS superfamily) [Vibrio sp. B1FIG11]CAE6934395.1 COG0659 Sulfate permease and related transporters (MFS superfamily) [Vibrio sp. B1FIG11]
MKKDILSGLTVALALIPEAVAFAFVAGVDPMAGLYAAFIVGLVTSIIGGRPGMISGATGAMAVVMVSLVAIHGVQYLFAAIMLAGIIQLTAGLFKRGKFIRIVPHPVMIGFVNGLAIVIFLAQLGQFKAPDINGILTWLPQDQMLLMISLVALTMAIIHFLPTLTTAVPSSLVAIVTVTALVVGLDLETRTVIDFLRTMSVDETATLAGSLPSFSIPAVPFTVETLQIILPYAVILAAIGLIESLLTLTILDEITSTRGQPNRECIGQGIANLTCSVFGAMGGCAMIGQSMINVNSGGRGRLSGIVAAISLLLFILFASSLIEMIPLAALVGVMFMVVISTFEWATFKLARRVPKQDFFVIVLVTLVTVLTDLAVAVAVGVIASTLMFAWEHAKYIYAETSINEEGIKEYKVYGPIFFGSTANFLELFNVHDDPRDVVVDFANTRVTDHSAIAAIVTLTERYQAQNKQIHLKHLSPSCRQRLDKASNLNQTNINESPNYTLVVETLNRQA